MNMQERYDDIAKRTGLSEAIVRRVLGATRDSFTTSLKRGESVLLPGICSISADFVSPFNLVTGEKEHEGYVKASIKLSQSLKDDLKNTVISEDKIKKRTTTKLNYVSSNSDESKIRTKQLKALL